MATCMASMPVAAQGNTRVSVLYLAQLQINRQNCHTDEWNTFFHPSSGPVSVPFSTRHTGSLKLPFRITSIGHNKANIIYLMYNGE